MTDKDKEGLMEKLVSLCKRRGFVYQGSEIYGGLAGTWDYGPLGAELVDNIKNCWWKKFLYGREDMYKINAAILMNPSVWEASGHVSGFADPLASGKLFNTMFKTSAGAGEEAATVYLRPETAGGIFVNFKNVVDSFHPKLPFGIGQIGKAFRNEIAPRDFVFRARELEQMEIEYFIRPEEWEQKFEEWRKGVHEFMEAVGITKNSVHELEVPDGERAHYSKRTIDFEFDFPFGRKELCGLAYRGDFDLSAHEKASTVELKYQDPDTNEKFTPHVIEPSFGVERTFLAVLASAYAEDEQNGEKRVYLKFKPSVAPVKAAVFPLLKNKPELVAKAREIYTNLKSQIPNIVWDDNGNVGKRYRRQDEIGTPFCITVDFDTLGETPEMKDTVTVRDRDSGAQERVAAADLPAYLLAKIRV